MSFINCNARFVTHIEAKDGGGGDNWTTGAPDALPVTQPTVSKH